MANENGREYTLKSMNFSTESKKLFHILNSTINFEKLCALKFESAKSLRSEGKVCKFFFCLTSAIHIVNVCVTIVENNWDSYTRVPSILWFALVLFAKWHSLECCKTRGDYTHKAIQSFDNHFFLYIFVFDNVDR